MKTLYGIAHNIVFTQSEPGKTIPNAEIVLMLMEPEYQADPNDTDQKVKRILQYQTIRFHAEASACSDLASALTQISQHLANLGETQTSAPLIIKRPLPFPHLSEREQA